MKKNLKRRLAVWLCLVLVLQAVSTILPTRELFTEEVKAKVTYNMYFTGFSDDTLSLFHIDFIAKSGKIHLVGYLRIYLLGKKLSCW